MSGLLPEAAGVPAASPALVDTVPVLLITGDPGLPPAIDAACGPHGFRVRCESDVQQGFRAAAYGRFGLVLIDAAIGAAEVVRMVRQLRQRSPVPIIVMSTLRRRADLVEMLESGADDYVSGPIEPAELVARVRAVWRRATARRPPARDVIDAGGIRVEPASRVARADGRRLSLTSIEYDVLEYLVREAGRIVSRDELSASVCGRAASPLDRALDVHISHLRRKLGRHGTQILTVRGVGYMLAAPGGGGGG